jgi:hypothetical protein
MSFPLAISILDSFQCSCDIEPVREYKPIKVKAIEYTQQEQDCLYGKEKYCGIILKRKWRLQPKP